MEDAIMGFKDNIKKITSNKPSNWKEKFKVRKMTRRRNTLMSTKFALERIGKVYYMQIIFGKPRKDYLIPISKQQAGKFSKEYSLQIGKWDKVPENFTVL